jgi:hypothetical protein
MNTGDASDAVSHAARGLLSRASWNKNLFGIKGNNNMALAAE